MVDSPTRYPTALSPHVALGAGCYWGTEQYVWREFQKKFSGSIRTCRVGFMSPEPDAVAYPSYQDVCASRTSYIEVVHVELFNPEAHFKEIIRFFFQFHDPTCRDRQGNDIGEEIGVCCVIRQIEDWNEAMFDIFALRNNHWVILSIYHLYFTGKHYASAIFVHDDEQKRQAEAVRSELQDHLDSGRFRPRGIVGIRIATKIHKANTFYEAHEEHQKYIEKNPFCMTYGFR